MWPDLLGVVVIYRTDGRNGLVYDLPAIVTCTRDSHPGDYPDGTRNPLPVPDDDEHLHLTVFTPGGFGTTVSGLVRPTSGDFPGAEEMTPGSGTYVEWNVPPARGGDDAEPRTWRWPTIR